jgi:cyclin-dependent kinase regulatory subunit CKS1
MCVRRLYHITVSFVLRVYHTALIMAEATRVQRPDFFSSSGPTREAYSRIVNNLKASIHYSERYRDDSWEYRHVRLPKQYEALLPKRLMSEEECRTIGVQQSPGWEHYMVHRPEPWVLLFRRPLPDPAHETAPREFQQA